MLDFIWGKIPGFVKWPVIIGVVAFMLPVRIYEGAKGFIHSEVHAIIIPMKEKRDMELIHLREDITAIKEDTRDIKNILMKRGE